MPTDELALIRLAQFQQMRFAVMSSTLTEDGGPFGRAYVYAWYEKVYPVSDEGADWHEPFDDLFVVGRAQMLELLKFLDQRWLDKKPITFWELEDHYQARLDSSKWDRVKLLGACRYFFLHSVFDKPFWDAVAAHQKSPVEANAIVDPQPDHLYFQ